MTPKEAQFESARRTHCSSLIKRTKDGDVYLGHTTWNLYTGMFRQRSNMEYSYSLHTYASVGAKFILSRSLSLPPCLLSGMVRLFKSYSLPLSAAQTNAKTITFSSYPVNINEMKESGIGGFLYSESWGNRTIQLFSSVYLIDLHVLNSGCALQWWRLYYDARNKTCCLRNNQQHFQQHTLLIAPTHWYGAHVDA